MQATTDQIFRESGRRLAAAISGCSAPEYHAMRGYQHARERGDLEPVSRALCKFAADIFAERGAASTVPGLLYSRLSDESLPWSHGYEPFAETVSRALTKVANDQCGEDAYELSKLASVLPATVLAAHESLGGNLLKTLLAAGALSGVGAGSLSFVLNRSADQTSAANAALLEKAITYKKLQLEIEEDLEAKGLKDVARRSTRFKIE
jgi:hypothetical protein